MLNLWLIATNRSKRKGNAVTQESVSRSLDKYILRLPDGMRERIRERAMANRRSMNAEIVHYLDDALGAQEEKGPAEGATSPSHVTHQPS